MKIIRLIVFALFLAPIGGFAATNNQFMVAAQLLAAAKNADIQQVQALVNNGADVNFVDSTGVSIVCTALMNNDVRAAQILQMYGADASQCDRQIKQYKNRTKPKDSGGMFSGLSSAQSISLAAAGAAVVVGGLYLLTDVLDPGNDNNPSSGGGNRPGGGGNSGSDDSNATEAFAKLPFGPACDSQTGVCSVNVDDWSPDADNVRAWDFATMKPFNYLMMTYAYNAFARGYMGMDTIRISTDKTPYDLGSLPWVGDVPSGGRPVTVATITENGVNATGSLADGTMLWVVDDNNQIKNAQAQCTQFGSSSTQCQTALANLVQQARKFYNRENLTDLTDLTERTGFDFSGHGTVFGDATYDESLIAKVIAGWEYGGRSSGDWYGFVPNGQLSVYRTGGGLAIDEAVGVSSNADGATAWANNDTFTVNGVEYKLVVGTGGALTAVNVADDSDVLDVSLAGNVLRFAINQTNYEAAFNGDVSSMKVIDYKNFDAMLAAAQLRDAGNVVNSVIANVAQNSASMNANYLNMRDFKSLISGLTTDAARKSAYAVAVNEYYNLNTSDDDSVDTPGDVANALYTFVGNNQGQIIVNSVGAYEYGVGDGKSIAVLDPTFENYAPVLYPNLEHLYVSVVAVQNQKGTSAIGNISDYDGTNTSTGKITLSRWGVGLQDGGTAGNLDDYEYVYSSRKCGDGGLGVNGIDPWCFAAPGANSEMSVASMAGAIASVQSAFSYLTNQQVFALLALSADGAYLGTNPTTRKPWTDQAELVAYLQARYELPGEYSPQTDEEYLNAFKEVFGYGLINLERATKPGATIYYYNGQDIVSANGNAYWRAATNTTFKPSSALSLRGASVRAPFFDVLDSADGEMSVPRVWENEFSFGVSGRRGLYMGDVLGDLKTRRDVARRTQIGELTMSMSVSERAYNDNLGGLDNLSLDYTSGNWNFTASYQHYLTDGASRFSGMSNPVLGLTSNAIVSDMEYGHGSWTFGGRAFSGAITDEGLLENDPTISAQYMPARLGMMHGMDAHVAWQNDKWNLVGTVGNANETNTVLGAQSGGLLDMGNGNTTFVDAFAQYKLSDGIELNARATFARTTSDAAGEFILGMEDIKSNAFAFGANVGGFEFSVAQPLAITDGAFQYAHAEYDIVEMGDGKYELNVVDTHVANMDLRADKREVRFAGTYRHKFGEYTDGAFGFIYRVNPNHTDEFGNESVFMMKLTHRLGI